MCRLEDDCAWWIEDTNPEAVSETEQLCEDCFRKIAPGEIHTVFTAMPGDGYEGDEPKYIWVAQDPALCEVFDRGENQWRSFDPAKIHFRIDEDDSDVWEALGFLIFEEENPDLGPEYHVSCTQCVKANKWLQVICNQHVVMVTREDLNEHLDEYDAEQLGESFVMLVESVNRKWRRSMGISLLTPQWVEEHTQRAIEHAIAHGLQDA